MPRPVESPETPELARPRYALVVRLPRRAATRIEDAYLRLPGITRPPMGYHITLLGSFWLAEGVGLEALDPVRVACAGWAPFAVQIAGLGAFEDQGANIVYLGVVECDRVVPLHIALLDALAGRITFPNEKYRLWNTTAYAPHVTLGLGVSDSVLASLLESSPPRALHLDVPVDAVSLVTLKPASVWRYLAEYPLGVV
jgi:2'-5' RNA ligase